jgi:hypothetical protein
MYAKLSMAKAGGFSHDCITVVRKGLSKKRPTSDSSDQLQNVLDIGAWVEADVAELALEWNKCLLV